MTSDRNIEHLYPAFADRYTAVLADMQRYLDVHYPGWTCKLIEGLRSAAYQHQLWLQGRTTPGPVVTQRDGYHVRSNHQSGLAADIGYFDEHGNYVERDVADVNAYYGHLVRLNHLEWGGDWKSFKDYPHAEWPASDHETYIAAGKWLQSEGLA